MKKSHVVGAQSHDLLSVRMRGGKVVSCSRVLGKHHFLAAILHHWRGKCNSKSQASGSCCTCLFISAFHVPLWQAWQVAWGWCSAGGFEASLERFRKVVRQTKSGDYHVSQFIPPCSKWDVDWAKIPLVPICDFQGLTFTSSKAENDRGSWTCVGTSWQWETLGFDVCRVLKME